MRGVPLGNADETDGSRDGPDQGPADDAVVGQSPGVGSGAEGGADSSDAPAREVGVTAAVERGPAELSSEGDPVRDDARERDREPARSTDEL